LTTNLVFLGATGAPACVRAEDSSARTLAFVVGWAAQICIAWQILAR
jgi:hypothetical protein